MKLPETIRIGWMDIHVNYTNEAYLQRGEFFSYSSETRTIIIDPTGARSVLANRVFRLAFGLGCDMLRAGPTSDELWQISDCLYTILRDAPILSRAQVPIGAIRVLGRPIIIELNPNMHHTLGQYQNTNDHIVLAADLDDQTRLQAFWHEMMHFVTTTVLGYKYDDTDAEENAMEIMAWVISAMTSQNDLTWLVEQEEEDVL